jgi:hypothetical protein
MGKFVDSPNKDLERSAKMQGAHLLIRRQSLTTQFQTAVKESSEETAWFHHNMIPLPGHGWWVSLRPVLDKFHIHVFIKF